MLMDFNSYINFITTRKPCGFLFWRAAKPKVLQNTRGDEQKIDKEKHNLRSSVMKMNILTDANNGDTDTRSSFTGD